MTRTSHPLRVVVGGEVRTGVALAGAGLGGRVGLQGPDERDAVPGGLRDETAGGQVAGVEVVPSRRQALRREGVVDGAGHLHVGDRGAGGGHAGDQVRERGRIAVPVVAGAGAAAGRGVVAGLGDVQLVAERASVS